LSLNFSARRYVSVPDTPFLEPVQSIEPRLGRRGFGYTAARQGAAVPLRIGVDIGGTFTDLVALDEATGTVVNAKALSTPSQLIDGVLRCVDQAGVDLGDCRLTIHGTTIGINALLEGKGALTALLTTEGFRDVVEIGRGNFLRMYDVLYRRPTPLVPRGRRREVPERISARGEVLVPLGEDAVREAARALAAEGVESVAVAFLFSYLDPIHEQRAAAILAAELPGVAISVSHRLSREWREYERTNTTVVNAYVLPIVERYLATFEQRLAERGFRGSVLVTQSNGGASSLAAARERAVHTLESGPAAGAVGCASLARLLQLDRAISFDMGGTTAKCAIVDHGMVQTTDEYHVDGRPLRIPVIDIREVSAGGGTIAWIDSGGALALGPQSAGAAPGPVCYGLGGTEPTVTDANVVLGRIDGSRFLGGSMPLDAAGAARAVDERLAPRLGLSRASAAAGVVRLVDVKMALAVRSITTGRGLDPRDYALVAYGGGGPLHVAALARELEIPRVVIPPSPSTFSAWGMLATDLRYEFVRTHVGEAGQVGAARLRRLFADMEAEGRRRLGRSFAGRVDVRRSVDMRYGEQTFEIQVPLDGVDVEAKDLMEQVVDRFHRRHEELYTYSAPGQDVVLVNARAAVIGRLPALPAEQERRAVRSAAPRSRRVYLERWMEIPVHDMDGLAEGQEVKGPAIFESATTTVLIRGRESAVVTREGWLDIRVG
jgi:N-methylhydantoinase A